MHLGISSVCSERRGGIIGVIYLLSPTVICNSRLNSIVQNIYLAELAFVEVLYGVSYYKGEAGFCLAFKGQVILTLVSDWLPEISACYEIIFYLSFCVIYNYNLYIAQQ